MNNKHTSLSSCSSSSPKSVLVIGTKPCVSMQRLRHLSFLSNTTTTQVHLLASNPFGSEPTQSRSRHFFTSVTRGEEGNPRHIEKALAASKARVVIIPMDENAAHHHHAQLPIQQQHRDETRLALAQVLGKPEFSRVQVLALSQTSTAVISYEKHKVSSSSSPRSKSPSSLASGSSRHSSSTSATHYSSGSSSSSSSSLARRSKPSSSRSPQKVPKPPVRRDQKKSQFISI